MEEDQDHPEVEVEVDHQAVDHQGLDHQEEDNLQLCNNQCPLPQMSKLWEVSHKSLMEINLRQMTLSKKSKATFALTPTFQDTTLHIRK